MRTVDQRRTKITSKAHCKEYWKHAKSVQGKWSHPKSGRQDAALAKGASSFTSFTSDVSSSCGLASTDPTISPLAAPGQVKGSSGWSDFFGACLYKLLQTKQSASMASPLGVACLSQMATLSKTLKNLQTTPSSVNDVAEIFDRQFHPAQLMPTPMTHDKASHWYACGAPPTLWRSPASPAATAKRAIGKSDKALTYKTEPQTGLVNLIVFIIRLPHNISKTIMATFKRIQPYAEMPFALNSLSSRT
mmetsp:Transcript_23666/g.71083  ORF Transcript_23666/g.71083 Transcript_23666/m.71083 type:complete len:247 (-) Transcript_23666:430-1170(-)